MSQFQVSPRRLIAFLWGYWSRYPFHFLGVLGAMAAAVTLDVLFPIVSARLIEAITQGAAGEPAAMSAVLAALGLFLGQALGFQLMRRLSFHLWIRFAVRVMPDIVEDAFEKVQRFSTDWHSNNFAGSTVRKITRGMWAYDSMADTLYMGFLPTLGVMTGTTLVLLLTWPLLGLFIFAMSAVYLAFTLLVLKHYVVPRNRAYIRLDSEMGGVVADAITCNAVVKAYGAEKREAAHFHDFMGRWATKGRRAWSAMENMVFGQSLILFAMQGGMLGYIVWNWSQGAAGTDDVVFAMTTSLLINANMREIGFHFQQFQQALNEIEDLIEFADMDDEIAPREGAPALHVRTGAIRFDKVSFTYPKQKRATFTDLSVSIRGGEKVALVGRSGSGKSSFVKLIQTLYDPGAGRILIDGQDIATLNRESVRRSISLVPQEPILFHRSIAENIGYARPGASQAEIELAAKRAHAHEFIEGLPAGYETLVGERGVKLSGGERQRVAIARAFLADLPILILDEATSSLDSVTERLIQSAIDELTEGRTTIIIAHRLSTIRKVDRILVFEKGEIVEQGTHAELMSVEGGHFETLKTTQLEGVRLPAE